MLNNFKFFEENKCGDVFSLIDEYLESLKNIYYALREDINTQRIKLNTINQLLNNNVEIPFSELVSSNEYSNTLLRKYKTINYKITEVDNIMNNSIVDNKKNSLKFFKRVLVYYVEKEEYSKCKTLQNVIDLLI